MSEMRKWIDLIEAKGLDAFVEYGAWLHRDGMIEYVEEHDEWVWDTYGSDNYYNAYDDGWIRVVFGDFARDSSFHLEGYLDDIKIAFKYWWPTAIKSCKVWIETRDTSKWFEFEMPKDRIKLQQDFGQKSSIKEWIDLTEENTGGDCYQAAWRKITSMDSKEAKSWRLVHAEVVGTGGIKGKHFGHAWLEKTEDFRGFKHVMVLDCANNRNVELPKNFYYDVGGVVDESGKLFRYTADEARIGVQSGHYGSWELDIEKDTVIK